MRSNKLFLSKLFWEKNIFKAHMTFNLNLKKQLQREHNFRFANKRHLKSKLNFCHMIVLTTFDTLFRPSTLMFPLYFQF